MGTEYLKTTIIIKIWEPSNDHRLRTQMDKVPEMGVLRSEMNCFGAKIENALEEFQKEHGIRAKRYNGNEFWIIYEIDLMKDFREILSTLQNEFQEIAQRYDQEYQSLFEDPDSPMHRLRKVLMLPKDLEKKTHLEIMSKAIDD